MEKELDAVELQSFAAAAEATAKKLAKKHNGNLSRIEKEVRETIGIEEEKEFAEEVLWAITWILQYDTKAS